MRNFYFLTTFNLTNPIVQSMLNRLKISEMSNAIVDFKIRSRLYRSFSEAAREAQIDFNKKLPFLFNDELHHEIASVTVMNPSFMGGTGTSLEAMAKYGVNAALWDENCCGALFFSEKYHVENEEDPGLPPSMMFKYEIMYSEDAIEFAKNGDFVISPANIPGHTFNSTYH